MCEGKAASHDEGMLIEFSMVLTRSADAVHNARMRSPSHWRSLALLLFLLVPLPVLAWNAAGHRLVASIAWDRLDEHSRSTISQLLRQHPDYARWIRRAGDDDPRRVAFIEASTWPDNIRKDNRFYNAGVEEATPTLPGFPDMERRRNWHYVNRPLEKTPRDHAVSGLLDQQLVALARTLASPGSTDGERSYALPWLIHLAGDAHQPLHTSIRLDADGKWDRFGDGMTVINPFNSFKSRQASSTLHAFWDDLPGPPWLRGDRLRSASQALAALYPPPPPSAPGQWIDESWQIARNDAYPPGTEHVPVLTAEFFAKAKAIAERRVAAAGYRLADLLREVFAGGKRPGP